MKTPIRDRRTDLRLPLERLALDTGLSYSYLAKIEAGERRPSLASAKVIADALGWSLDEFFSAWTITLRANQGVKEEAAV